MWVGVGVYGKEGWVVGEGCGSEKFFNKVSAPYSGTPHIRAQGFS